MKATFELNILERDGREPDRMNKKHTVTIENHIQYQNMVVIAVPIQPGSKELVRFTVSLPELLATVDACEVAARIRTP